MAEEVAKPVKPSQYRADLAEEICRRIAEGETLPAICREEHMPHFQRVYDWIEADTDGFRGRIERARELGAEAIAQDTFDIADDGRNDWMEKYDKDGNSLGYMLNGEHVQRSKLRIETRLKLLAKWHPKKYGEKVDVNHGGQADNPISALLQLAQGSALPLAKTVEGEVIEGDDD